MNNVGKVDWGVTSTFGVAVALVSLAGTIWAAFRERDVATIVAGSIAALTGLGVLAGRFAQAVAKIRAQGLVQMVDQTLPPEVPPVA